MVSLAALDKLAVLHRQKDKLAVLHRRLLRLTVGKLFLAGGAEGTPVRLAKVQLLAGLVLLFLVVGGQKDGKVVRPNAVQRLPAENMGFAGVHLGHAR